MKKLLSKVLIATLSLGVISILSPSPTYAAANLYLSPAGTTVAQGSTLSVAVRVNSGGDPINAVQANLSYPADKLDFLSISASGSGFEIQAENVGGGGSVKIARGTLSAKKGDQLVATITFKAKPSSGSATVSFTSGSAVVRTSDSKNILSGKSGGIYTFKKAPPPPKPDKTTPKISDVKVVKIGVDTATVTWKTNEKATSVVEYGYSKKLGIAASNTKLKTKHEVKLSSKILLAGTKFYYRVLSKDAAGNTAKSKLTSFKTKGYTIQIKVLDQEGNPLVGAEVTLLPSLESGTTDEKGVVVFKNIAPGKYAVQIEIEDQKLSDTIEVKETGKLSEGQKFDIKVDVKKAGLQEAAAYGIMLLLGLIAVIIAAGFFWMRRKKPSSGTKSGIEDSLGDDIHFVQPKDLPKPIKGDKPISPKSGKQEQPSKPTKPQESKPLMPINEPKI